MDVDLSQRVEETTGLLRDWCVAEGVAVAGDGSIVEADAERALGYGAGTLRTQRQDGTCCLPRRRVGNRWRYRLRDLAELIERGYEG